MSMWWRSRVVMAVVAVVVALATALATVAFAESPQFLVFAALYVVTVGASLVTPSAIVAQIVGGQALAGALLLSTENPSLLALTGVIAGVVLTSELLGIVARLGMPIERDPGPDTRQAGFAALVGATVFAVVFLLGRLPGLEGMAGAVLAAVAAIGLAVWMVKGTTSKRVAG